MKIRHFALVLTVATVLTACDKSKDEATVAEPVATATGTEAAPAIAAPAAPASTGSAAAAPKPKIIYRDRPAAEPKVICNDCGVITSMTAIKKEGEGSGAGAVLGAIAGGFAGNQFGGGHGKEAATAAGAIAGGFGGNMAEKKIRETTAYKITVKMDSGYTRTVTVGSETAANYSVGSKVRVDGENNLSLR